MTDLLQQLENIGIIEFTILSQYCQKNYWQQSCWQLKHQMYKRQPEPVLWRDEQLCYYEDVPVICCLIVNYYGDIERFLRMIDTLKKLEPTVVITNMYRTNPEIATVSMQMNNSPIAQWLSKFFMQYSIV